MDKERIRNNRGFTLVELVVVLVILALLAALIMPGLLGYVDGVNEKAYINNAKAAITAAQSELSALYQSGKRISKGTDRQKWAERMDFEEGSTLSVKCYPYKEENPRASYTIMKALYTEGDYSVYYDAASAEYVVEAATNEPDYLPVFESGEFWADLDLIDGKMVTE